jgi:hypothetical protein
MYRREENIEDKLTHAYHDVTLLAIYHRPQSAGDKICI